MWYVYDIFLFQTPYEYLSYLGCKIASCENINDVPVQKNFDIHLNMLITDFWLHTILSFFFKERRRYIFPNPEPELAWEFLGVFRACHIHSSQESLYREGTKHNTCKVLSHKNKTENIQNRWANDMGRETKRQNIVVGTLLGSLVPEAFRVQARSFVLDRPWLLGYLVGYYSQGVYFNVC